MKNIYIPSLKGIEKDCYFENGSPVNPDGWEQMKKLPEECLKHKKINITYTLIDATFNRVIDSFGIVRHQKIHRFALFCKQNELEFKEIPEKKMFEIWKYSAP